MPTMVCVPCGVFFRVEHNGVSFIEGFGDGQQRPYKLWMADLYQCPSCKTRVIAGLGRGPAAEHYEPEWPSMKAHLTPRYFVDDCPSQCVHDPEPLPEPLP